MNKGLLACYICGSKDIFKYPTLVNGFELHSCKSCETGFTHPLPSDQYLQDYYDRSEWFEGGEFGGYENYEKQSRSSDELVKRILSEFDSKEGLSVLDVGCGYGSHLAIASAKGWKCFGVEKSKHARAQAKTKLKNSAFISENILDLPNRPFDLVLILDTIEHLTNPREMFYELFSIGAISEKTVVAITTPNAGPSIASLKLDAWKYCHPPSHLFYFSKISFEFLLTELRFGSVTVEGMHPQLDEQGVVQSEGLFVSARGSDFEEFMHERYVPGTWSFLAKYEHIPRYSFANRYIKGSRVLDFGCGTGYGSLSLAKFADHVTGLDIDVSAIKYANSKHVLPNLDYVVSSSLGAELVNNSFDVITCFEMIEHVDQPTQVAAVKSFKKLLAVDGTLIISTPNPVVTSKYGPNPYHLREMSKGEFLELLRPEFKYVQIIEQYVEATVRFSCNQDLENYSISPVDQNDEKDNAEPLAYLAICSNHEEKLIDNQIYIDTELDFIDDYIKEKGKKNRLLDFASRLNEDFSNQNKVSDMFSKEVHKLIEAIEIKDIVSADLSNEVRRLEQYALEKDALVAGLSNEVRRLEQYALEKDGVIKVLMEENHKK